MIRKSIRFITASIGVIALAAMAAVAQDTAPAASTAINGVIKIKKDGTTGPLPGVTVACFNLTDFTEKTNTKCPSVTTDAEGKFSLTGLSAEGKYIIAISGTSIGPRITAPIKPGDKIQEITVEPGEGGQVMSKLEVWQAYAFASGAAGADQKKARENYEAELAAKQASNEQIQQKNELIQTSLSEGNNAYNSGDFTTAIAKYQQGIDADPDFLGSAPVLMNNKGAALKKRAVNVYNESVKSSDAATRDGAKDKALADLAASLKSYGGSFKLLSGASSASISDQATHKKNIFNALDGGRDAVRIMALIQVADADIVGLAREVTIGFMGVEKDKAKQQAAQTNLAKYLLYAYDYDGAAAEFKKALKMTPKDPDILANLGIALFTAAEINQNMGQRQESLNYLDYYLKVAPKEHKMRGGVEETVKDLRNVHKLKPKKIS